MNEQKKEVYIKNSFFQICKNVHNQEFPRQLYLKIRKVHRVKLFNITFTRDKG